MRDKWKVHYGVANRRAGCGVVIWLGFGSYVRSRVTCLNCRKLLGCKPGEGQQ